jgi:hypothetical protein
MVAFRSRRIESLLGTRLEDVKPEHLHALVSDQVPEAFDLDFKAELYGNGESDRRALATDVAALANTAGGLLVLGIGEDGQSRAATAPGVSVADSETRRIRNIIASLVSPLPVLDVLPVEDPGTPGQGFVIIAVVRGPSAPHAVLVNDGFRYPRRNGAITRYLSEPEVATAYRDRFTAASDQAGRAQELEAMVAGQLFSPINGAGWVVLSLVPDAPGELLIGQATLRSAQAELLGTMPTVLPTALSLTNVHVGRRCLLVSDAVVDYAAVRQLTAVLCHDGAGAFAMNAHESRSTGAGGPRPAASFGPRRKSRRRRGGRPDSARPTGDVPAAADPEASQPDPRPHAGTWLHDEQAVNAILTGLRFLGRHARDRAAAGGNALVRAHVHVDSRFDKHSVNLGTGGRDVSDSRWVTDEDRPVQPAEFAAPLDALADDGPDLVAAAYLLASDLFQAFSLPEVLQLTRDGQIRGRYWNTGWIPQIREWAAQAGVTVTDEVLPGPMGQLPWKEDPHNVKSVNDGA